MLTTLSTLKSRLGLTEFDVKDDAILTNALNAVSTRFDKESNRDKLGLKTIWPHEGSYMQFLQSDLLPAVKAVLKQYARWSL